MNLSVGIVGLPNVGKSTLFNALLKKQQVLVANFPFTTIEPNVGVVPVPDPRLEKLADVVAGISTSEESDVSLRSTLPPSEVSRKIPPIVPATVKFVDIAGLVKGANEGAGLGNKFLSHIREASIICHVVRAFEDPNVIKEGSFDPKTDYETVQTELMLADLSTISNIKNKILKTHIKNQKEVAVKLWEALNKGIPAREIALIPEEQEITKTFFLLSAKPEIIVLNVAEKDYSRERISEVIKQYSQVLSQGEENFEVVSAKIESELSELSERDKKQYLKDLGLVESGLERFIKKAYQTLGLISFFTTTGEKEVRAWAQRVGQTAIDAAGIIHSDFAKYFIKAEVISFDDFVKYGGWRRARELGKTRLEGKDYMVEDGDIIEFKTHSSMLAFGGQKR